MPTDRNHQFDTLEQAKRDKDLELETFLHLLPILAPEFWDEAYSRAKGAEICRRANISESRFSRWVNGNVQSCISADAVRRIVRVMPPQFQLAYLKKLYPAAFLSPLSIEQEILICDSKTAARLLSILSKRIPELLSRHNNEDKSR
jgi:hypothetical protein